MICSEQNGVEVVQVGPNWLGRFEIWSVDNGRIHLPRGSVRECGAEMRELRKIYGMSDKWQPYISVMYSISILTIPKNTCLNSKKLRKKCLWTHFYWKNAVYLYYVYSIVPAATIHRIRWHSYNDDILTDVTLQEMLSPCDGLIYCRNDDDCYDNKREPSDATRRIHKHTL